MSDIAALVAGNLDIWTSAIQRKSGAGRGGGKRISLYGIERLRALILDLAVRGKLVPQDARDEPARELLKRIPGDWALSRRRSRSAGIQPDEPSGRTVPAGWISIPGNTIFRTRSGNSKLIKGKLFAEDGPDRFPGYSASGQDVWLADWEHDAVAIILSAVGARCGKAFLARGKWSAVANTHIVWLNEEITDADFAMLVLNNENFWDRAGGAQPFIKVGNTLDRGFMLPPLAEQRRIVAKVDELMALCDALERESADAMAAHQALVEELLATLVNSPDATDLAVNWARLESHFDTLFTTDASIEALKQTILDLAVRGILVAGVETKDKSRSTVALASKAKKAMSEAEGLRARTPIARGKLSRPEEAFPSHWTFTDFDSVFVTVSGVTKGQKISPSEAIEAPYLRVANVQRGQLDLVEMKTITVKHSDFKRYQLREGDVLMTEGGDWDKLGRAAIWRNEVPNCIHQNHVFRVRFEQNAILPEWVVLFVNSPLGREFFSRAAKQTTNLASINMTQLRSCPIPIPAYAEQHRIVAKVDALMALCDQLKTRLADAAQTQRHLADAITERAAA